MKECSEIFTSTVIVFLQNFSLSFAISVNGKQFTESNRLWKDEKKMKYLFTLCCYSKCLHLNIDVTGGEGLGVGL